MIIADTNVVSEFMKDSPNHDVLMWASTLDPADLTISVITVEEIERGIGRLPHGRRRSTLEQRWHSFLDAHRDTIAVYDLDAARATAHAVVEALGRGQPLSLADAQIAGICLAMGATLATRNTKDFAGIPGLTLTNPFA